MGHRCKNRELQVNVVHNDELMEMEDDPVETAAMDSNLMETSGMAECQLNTIIGFSTPGTIKVRGTIQGRDVVVLIDCIPQFHFTVFS